MHIAHSKISKPPPAPKKSRQRQSDFAAQMNHKLYKKACKKYEDRIKRIQEFFPGAMPPFKTNAI